MTAIAVATALAMLIISLAPATPVGRFLHHWLAAVPARRLSAVRGGAVMLALLAVLAFVATAWFLDAEAVHLLAMTAPDAASWLTMVEAGTIVEGVVALVAARTVLTLSTARIWIARWGPRRARSSRRKLRAPANDQEDDLRLAA